MCTLLASKGRCLGRKVPVTGGPWCSGADAVNQLTGRNAIVIVGAGAVVVKDVPDDAIVAGVPAQVIKMRNKGSS